MQEDEKALVGLYHRRQELFKELHEVDSKIRAIELRSSKKERQTEGKVPKIIPPSSDDDPEISKIIDVINASMAGQDGYRTAQLVLEEACQLDDPELSDEDKTNRRTTRNAILRETFKRATDLMVDPNGNYYMQRVISLLKPGGIENATLEGSNEPNADQSEVLLLLDSVGADLAEIACNMHGTRTVQRLIDVLTSCEEFELFSDLVANDLVMMIKDLNGNHAVLRLLLANNFVHLGADAQDDETRERGQSIRKDIYHIIATNCVEICVNRQGCCIIQRCLQSAPDPFRSEIVTVALNNVLALVQDPFGNYVIQYVLDLQNQETTNGTPHPNYTNKIIRQMLHHISALSCNKFGSNVIEKCLKSASSDVRQLMIDELTDPHAMPKLLTDSFANYVVQTAIMTASDDAQFHQLRDAILPLQHLLKNSPYGVKIEAKLQKRSREASKRTQQGGGGAPAGNRKRGGRGGRGGGAPNHQQHTGQTPPPEGIYTQQFAQAPVAQFAPMAQVPSFPMQQQGRGAATAAAGWSQQQGGYTAVQRLAAQQQQMYVPQEEDQHMMHMAHQNKSTHSPYGVGPTRF